LSLSILEASAGVFVPYLNNLAGLLDRAAAHAEARRIDPAILLSMRLSPDMYNFAQQVDEALRHATTACALLAGCGAPASATTTIDVAELKRRIAAAIAFIEALSRPAIDAAADKEVVFTFKNGAMRTFTGRSLLLSFSSPQFFFHVTTAYDILRYAGVELAKKDFLGPPRIA
jgi:hypothetical protein